MRHIRKNNDIMEEYSGPGMGDAWYAANGYAAYTGVLPLSRLDISDGAVIELPEPEPTEEWAAKRPFVSAITALLADETKAALAGSWQTQAWIAQLPGETVDLLDAEVRTFLSVAGLTLAQVREKMEA